LAESELICDFSFSFGRSRAGCWLWFAGWWLAGWWLAGGLLAGDWLAGGWRPAGWVRVRSNEELSRGINKNNSKMT